MGPTDDEAHGEGRGTDGAPDEVLLAPAAILEGLPDAVVAARRDGTIV